MNELGYRVVWAQVHGIPIIAKRTLLITQFRFPQIFGIVLRWQSCIQIHTDRPPNVCAATAQRPPAWNGERGVDIETMPSDAARRRAYVKGWA